MGIIEKGTWFTDTDMVRSQRLLLRAKERQIEKERRQRFMRKLRVSNISECMCVIF